MYSVVIIDDHQVVCAAIRSLLERQGQFSVVSECNSGISGLSAARELRPDLLIVDLDIPQLGGIQVIRRLRAAGIPMSILVVSGAEETTSALQALHSGADGFISKSGDASELVNAALLVARGTSYFSQHVLRRAMAAIAGVAPITGLSGQEFEVFKRLAKGMSNSDIARDIFISPKTVSGHKVRLMQKLGINNIRDLIRLAQANGVIDCVSELPGEGMTQSL